eukprot:g1833.t1
MASLSSSSSSAGEEDALLRKNTKELISALHQFDVPTTGDVNFVELLDGPFAEETQALLKECTERRGAMVATLSYAGATPDPRNIVQEMKNYFSPLWRLTESLKVAREVQMKAQEFAWSSVLDRNARSGIWKDSTLVFELAQTLVQMALAMHNVAAHKSTTGDYVDASKHLRNAAGILKFVADGILPKWKPVASASPLEVERGIIGGIQRLMQAEAQQMAVAKALLGAVGKVPPALISKLFMGCKVLYDQAASSLRSVSRTKFEEIDQALLEVLGFFPRFFEAQSYRYAAKGAFGDAKYGLACKYAKRAEATIKSISPLHRGCLKAMNPVLQIEKQEIAEFCASILHENNCIYFDPEPEDDEIEELPHKVMKIASCAPFSPERCNVVSFAFSLSQNEGENVNIEDAVKVCVSMGFDEGDSRRALEACDADVNAAVERMVSLGLKKGEDAAGAAAEDQREKSAQPPQMVGTKNSKARSFKLELTVPEGVKPGDHMYVMDPVKGKKHKIKVPSNAKPGDTLTVTVETT